MSLDQSVKIYDIINFDMINMLKLPYIPSTCAWIHKAAAKPVIAMYVDYLRHNLILTSISAEKVDPMIHLYDAQGDATPIHSLKLHKNPIKLLKVCVNPPIKILIHISLVQ